MSCSIDQTGGSSSSSHWQIVDCATSITHTLTAGARTVTDTLALNSQTAIQNNTVRPPPNTAQFSGTITLNGATLVTAGPTTYTADSSIDPRLDDFARGYTEQITEEFLKADRGLATALIADYGYLSTGTHTNMDDISVWLYRLVFESLLFQFCPVLETTGVLANTLSVEGRALNA